MGTSSLTVLITAVDKASAAFGSVGKNAEAMSKKLAAVSKVVMGLGLAIGTVAVKAAADFDSSMREVNTMMGLTEDQFKAFKDEVRGASREMGVSAVDSAKAMYDAISAGIPKENAAAFLEIATKAAIGGVTETAIAVDGLTTVLNAFKKPVTEAGQVADVMFQAVNLGKITFEELAGTMNVAAPIAASLGVSFEELMGGVATLTKQGATGSIAMTQLRSAMVALITPNAQMNELLKKLHIESGKALLQTKGLSGAMAALRVAANDDETALAAAMGRVEGLNAVLGLTGPNADMAASDLSAMANAAGSTEKAVEQMDETLQRKLENLKSQFTDVAISLGETLMPAVISLAEKVALVVEKFVAWSDANPDLMDRIGRLVTVLVGSAGFVIALGKVISVVMQLRNALIMVQALSGPRGWAMLAAGIGIAAASIIGFNKLYTDMTMPQSITEEFGLVVGSEEWQAKQRELYAMGGTGNNPELSFASGGIVPGPIGQPVPVIAHGGEAFAGVGGGFGTTVNVYISGSVVAERDLAETIREQLLKLKGRNVRTGL